MIKLQVFITAGMAGIVIAQGFMVNDFRKTMPFLAAFTFCSMIYNAYLTWKCVKADIARIKLKKEGERIVEEWKRHYEE